LLHSLNPCKPLPAVTSLRLERYALFLQNYQYNIEYRNTDSHGNTDFCSRFPVECDKNPTADSFLDVDSFQIKQMSVLPIDFKNIAKETQCDSELSVLYNCLRTGSQFPPHSPLRGREHEFSLCYDCIMYGHRVLVPKKFQGTILRELHAGHQGITKMKLLSRSFVYWFNIDKDIETLCKSCIPCSLNRENPPKCTVHKWETPKGPWQRLHLDYAEFQGHKLLLCVDAYSKWLEVIPVSSLTATCLIRVLRFDLFARFGLPITIVTDNGPPFFSFALDEFLQKNGISHVFTPPYHPASNGQVERYVKTLKRSLYAALREGEGDLYYNLSVFLLAFRRTPNITTGESPASLFLKRNVRTLLDCVIPVPYNKINENRMSPDLHKCKVFHTGEHVLVRDYRAGKWITGTIVQKCGEVTYKVDVGNQMWFRHADQITSNANSPLDVPKKETVSIPTFVSDDSVSDSNFVFASNADPVVSLDNDDVNENVLDRVMPENVPQVETVLTDHPLGTQYAISMQVSAC
jgi:hypothetical protein